jgi:23S rRNA (uridine2552-2'-O)-methyltransferase
MVFKVKDYYFNKAKKENFLARSVYKLEEIDKKYRVLKKGNLVLDLGYSPGSWIQYTSAVIGKEGSVVGVDLKEINTQLQSLQNVKLFKKDIFDINDLSNLGVDRPFDVVLSDMAPDTIGIKTVDQIRSLDLVEKVFKLLPIFLKKGGNFVIKVFDSHEAQVFLKDNKNLFKELKYFKPKSTRSISKEFFVIGKGFQA